MARSWPVVVVTLASLTSITIVFAADEPPHTAAPPKDATPPPVATAPRWHERLTLGAFIDTYYSQNWRTPRPGSGANTYHPFNPNAGFGLAWLGLDAAMDPDPVGATLQLRFGPSVANLAGPDGNLPGGIGLVQNGYVSYRPGGARGPVTFIAGKFDTVFGAEVAQSQLNMNYTRGILYNLGQPFFHTGVRADWQVSERFTLKGLVVNGWNNTVDNNRSKSFGSQLSWTATDTATFTVGYLGGPEETDVTVVSCGAGQVFDAPTGACAATNESAASGPSSGKVKNRGADSRWRHLGDVVIDLNPTKQIHLVANGTYVTQTIALGGADRSAAWFGAAAFARYAFKTPWAVAVRGEAFRDANGQVSAPNTKALSLFTATTTLEWAPAPALLFRLDNRIDAASEPVFSTRVLGSSPTQLTTTLGVVAKTN